MATPSQNAPTTWKQRLYIIIFEADTPAGKAFDVLLLLAILLSVALVMLESVTSIRKQYGTLLLGAEWGLTLLFTIEYLLRLYSAPERIRYSRSFFGIIDLLSVMPTYISFLFPGAHYMLIVRILRLLRVFRIFKLARYIHGAHIILSALKASRAKIVVFLGAVVTIVIVIGALMYLIEGEEHGFTSIPRSVYWAIVTLTTVGYGDITPQTLLGRFVASLVMILGYAIIAVPTGIVTVELQQAVLSNSKWQPCPNCRKSRHDPGALYCDQCATKLSPESEA